MCFRSRSPIYKSIRCSATIVSICVDRVIEMHFPEYSLYSGSEKCFHPLWWGYKKLTWCTLLCPLHRKRLHYIFDVSQISLRLTLLFLYDSLIPNVSRNNISASQQENLSYAIGKAIHLWIRDHAELSTEQKALLDVFIETKYKETNYCLR